MLPPEPSRLQGHLRHLRADGDDLHQVIKANDDLTPEHHQFFLYQVRPSRSGDPSSYPMELNKAGQPSRVPSSFHPQPPRRFESRRAIFPTRF